MQRRSNQVDKMNQVPRSFTEQELQRFEKAELINLVLQQQLQQQPQQTSPNSPPRPIASNSTPSLSPQTTDLSPPSRPSVLRSLPFWLTLLGSLFLHGVVLLVPIVPSPETESDEEEVSTELLIPMTQQSPQPIPSPVQPSPPPTPPPTPDPPPVPASPVVPSPITPPPVVSPPVESPPEAAAQEPEPEATEPEPQPVQEPEANLEPLPSPDSSTPSEIAGVPLEAAWQILEQPIEGITDAQLYSSESGQMRTGILGLVNIPEADFETFFARYQQQLIESGFNIRPEGAYQGTPIYRLTSPTVEGSLFITLEPLEGGSILMAIWDQYPW